MYTLRFISSESVYDSYANVESTYFKRKYQIQHSIGTIRDFDD